ncbi:MAG: oligosaccharide flippase family protein [Gammaproteobacteria bacterium]|nr:oligosaccharide flippase family protein [Gammaproteobacteria bacterium]
MNGLTLQWLLHKRTSTLTEGSLRARFATGAFWSLVGAIISQGLALVTSIIVARVLGQVGFGEFGIINSTVGLFGVFAGLGLGMTATKYVAEFRIKDTVRAGRIIGLSTLVTTFSGSVLALVLFALAPVLATQTLNAPQLTNELRLACGLLFFNALSGAQIGALSGFEAFKVVALVNILRGFLNLPLVIGGVFLFGLPGAVGATVLVAALGWLINQGALQQECKRAAINITYRSVKIEWQILWKFSLPAVLVGAMTGPITWLANAILVSRPNGYAEMGVFNAANQWRSALVLIPTALSQVVLPILSNLYGQQAFVSYRKVLWINLLLVTLTSLVIAIPIMLSSELIMSTYGSGFAQKGSVLILIVLTTIISSSTGVVGSVITSTGKMWHGYALNVIWALSLITFTLIFIDKGAFGLALAYLLSYVVHFISVSTYVMSVLKNHDAFCATMGDSVGEIRHWMGQERQMKKCIHEPETDQTSSPKSGAG